MISRMHADRNKPDSELRIAGAKVTRAQYNVLYLDLIKYLDNVQRHTGRRPEVINLGDEVTLESGLSHCGGSYTKVYRGRYRGQLVSSTNLLLTRRFIGIFRSL